jgi:hypothetical protein
MRKKEMFTQILVSLSHLLNVNNAETLSSAIYYLAKGSLYLLISRPLDWTALFGQNHNNWSMNKKINERRSIMKGFSLYLNRIVVCTAFLFILNGCYTTFQDAQATDDFSNGYYYTQDYASENDEFYYEGDNYPDYAETRLTYRPSRLVVVENRYHNYRKYLRKVKYVVYEYDPWYDSYDPWYDPYYYVNDYDRFYFSFYIGIGNPYYSHFWINFGYSPFPYYCWGPVRVWYDPWYWHPVWYPYPVYYPVYVYDHHPYYYNPYPVYHKPHNPPAAGWDYNKRDWQKRQPNDGRRIVSRTPSNGRQDPGVKDSNTSRIIRRSDSAVQRNDQPSDNQTGRAVGRKQVESGQTLQKVEQKAPRNNIRAENNAVTEPKDVIGRQISRAPVNQITPVENSDPGRIIRRSDSAVQKNNQVNPSQNNRIIDRNRASSSQNLQKVEQKVPSNTIPTRNNVSIEPKELKAQQIPRASQQQVEKQIASPANSRKAETKPVTVKIQQIERNTRSNEQISNNRTVQNNSAKISRPQPQNESRSKVTNHVYQTKSSTGSQSSSAKYSAPAKQATRSSYSNPAPSRNSSTKMSSPKQEQSKSNSNKSTNSGRQSSTSSRKSR